MALEPTALLQKIVEYVLAGAFGWIVASFSFQHRLDQFEQKTIQPLREKVSKFEGAASTFVTREELKAAIGDLKADLKVGLADLKDWFRESIHRNQS